MLCRVQDQMTCTESPWYKRVSRAPQNLPTQKENKASRPQNTKRKHIYLKANPEKETRNNERLMPMAVAASAAALVWRRLRAAED